MKAERLFSSCHSREAQRSRNQSSGAPHFQASPKEQMENSCQEQSSWSKALMHTLENPTSEGYWSKEVIPSACPLYQQSLVILHHFPPLECGIQVTNRSMDYLGSQIVEGSDDSTYLAGMQDFCDTLPTLEGPEESVHHLELEAVGNPSYRPFSAPDKAWDSAEFRSWLKDNVVDHWQPEAVGRHPCFSISGPENGECLESFSEDMFGLEDIVGCTRNITELPLHEKAMMAEPNQVEDWETSSEKKSGFEEVEDLTQNIFGVPLLDDAVIREEVHMITSKIAGKGFCAKMEKAGSPILPPLLSSLQATLQEFKEKGLEVTLKVVRKEACKRIYTFMRDQNRKVAAHPEHIMEIPSNWLVENGNLYPPDEIYGKIAEDVGLEKQQVVYIFDNVRKRVFKNISGLNASLKSHFPPHITEKLRKWQLDNPGQQPNPESRQMLMDQTNCSKRQISEWFNNHKEGRDRSKKRIRTV